VHGRVIGGIGRLKDASQVRASGCDIVEVDVNDTQAAALGVALDRAGIPARPLDIGPAAHITTSPSHSWYAADRNAGDTMRTVTVIALLASFLLGGCCASRRIERREKSLAAIDLDADDAASLRAMPIIDVHTHTFNARYLPLKGIALGKRDKYIGADLVPDFVAETVTKLIEASTPLTPLRGGAPEPALVRTDAQPAGKELRERVLQEIRESGSQAQRDAISHPAVQQVLRLLEQSDEPEAARRMDMMRSVPGPTVEGQPQKQSEQSLLARVVPNADPGFIGMLRHPDGSMSDAYAAAYGLTDSKVLMVSHMMDLGPVYNQQPGEQWLLGFATDQIERMDYFQQQPSSKMIYFVGYNPFRSHWPDATSPSAPVDIVKAAVEKHGAFGVKFYPPSGYRPYSNQIPARPTDIHPEPGQQWDARYKGLKAKDLDAQVCELLDYCVQYHIPVFAHCSLGEFEARSGYGLSMASPEWWKRYLESAPKRANLRLCLGHAGGSSYWFNDGPHADWGRAVRDLCESFPNVYCEIGVEDEIADPRLQAEFVERLAKEFKRIPSPTRPFEFSKKLMYGTDWYMPISCTRIEYIRGYQRAFLAPELRSHYRDFFFNNAVDYLQLSTRKDDPRLPVEVRNRIAAMLTATADANKVTLTR
jgi:predicted TIM-barrel fold metal-dependent hydrolase